MNKLVKETIESVFGAVNTVQRAGEFVPMDAVDVEAAAPCNGSCASGTCKTR